MARNRKGAMRAMRPARLFLEHIAYQLRIDSLVMTSFAGSGHPTSCLSAAELVAVLFFYAMHYDPQNPNNLNNDRFILSKGHAAPLLYAVWKQLGVLAGQDLTSYRQFSSVLEGHPTMRFSRTEAATGSLGMGLSIAVGMALAARLDRRACRSYVLMGDAEVAEGSIWEAAELAAHYKLDTVIGLLDCNGLGQSTWGLHGHHVQRYADKFHAFGWHTIIVDGHDMQSLMSALDKAREPREAPTLIIAKTIKGYGLEGAEDRLGFHGKVFPKETLTQTIDSFARRFTRAAHYHPSAYHWQPRVVPLLSDRSSEHQDVRIDNPVYTMGILIATREAFGHALVALGATSSRVVSLDGDVKNSTYSEFFAVKFPERFFECFVAEQNMISMAVGFHRQGKIPFVSTFAAFLSRAHDQLRMSAIGQAPLRIIGSHAGIAIGHDGPSQMALEDIGMIRALPESVVLYPCDAVSTYKLMECMAAYDKGISYLRTTRSKTPVVYENSEQFLIGGCRVLRNSGNQVQACVVAAGITVFEALKACDALKMEGIIISVIDLYSIKPLDVTTLKECALAARKRVITVEDHYIQGGLGEAVVYALSNLGIQITCLAVRALPRSGSPEELMAWAAIDAKAISESVRSCITRNE